MHSIRLAVATALSLALGVWATFSIAEEPGTPSAYKKEIQVTPLLRAKVDGAGKPIVYPTAKPAQLTGIFVEIPPGTETGWHKHPYPCVAYILEGELDLELENAPGAPKKLVAGQAFAEVVDLMHNGVNRGTVPVKLVMFAIGEENQPYAIRPQQPTK